jgi:thioredoxin 1
MELNIRNFENEVLNFDGVALVDFFAVWCGPCKMQGPIVDELEKEFAGQPVKIGKIDVDESNDLAQKYQVMSVPTLILFKNGEPVETMVGLQSKEALKKKIELRI